MTPPDRAALVARIKAVLPEHGDVWMERSEAITLLRDVLSLLSAEPERPETIATRELVEAIRANRDAGDGWWEGSCDFFQDLATKVENSAEPERPETPRPTRHGYGCPHDGDELVRPRPDDCVCDDNGETAISREPERRPQETCPCGLGHESWHPRGLCNTERRHQRRPQEGQ